MSSKQLKAERQLRREQRRSKFLPKKTCFDLLPPEINISILTLLGQKSLTRFFLTCKSVNTFIKQVPDFYGSMMERTIIFWYIEYFRKIASTVPVSKNILVLTNKENIEIEHNYSIITSDINPVDDMPALTRNCLDLNSVCRILYKKSQFNRIIIQTSLTNENANLLSRFKWIQLTSFYTDSFENCVIILNFHKFRKMYNFVNVDIGLTRLNKSMRCQDEYDMLSCGELALELERRLVHSSGPVIKDIRSSISRLKPGEHLRLSEMKIYLKRLDACSKKEESE